MENRQPTGMEIREFWEWCGFYQAVDGTSNAVWIYPDGRERMLPRINLDNLFEWAVPKLGEVPSVTLKRKDTLCACNLSWEQKNTGEIKAPPTTTLRNTSALTLFWAVREVLSHRCESENGVWRKVWR